MVCAGGENSPLCAGLKENLTFLAYGAAMEDEGAKGFKTVLNGLEFHDEETDEDFGPCREKILAGKTYMYCNHYFFIESFLAGGPEGGCGKNILGATRTECGKSGFRWESARQRALRLWKEKVLRYYSSGAPNSRAYAYYWLGRVAHLIADVSVPAHVMPHEIGYVEFEHRAFEYEAGRLQTGRLPEMELPGDVNGLFMDLAGRAVKTHNEIRAEDCRRDMKVAGCDKMRASPSRPLESRISILNVLFVNSLIEGKESALAKPEMKEERELAVKQLKTIKPLTVLFTARLLKLFGAQAGLEVRDIRIPAEAPAAAPFESRAVDFDGISR